MRKSRKGIYILCFAIVLNLIIMLVNVSPFPNIIDGGYLSVIVSKIIWCVLFDLLLVFFTWKSKQIFDMPYEVIMNRNMIWDLSKNDFKVKYVGSYLGIFWAFVNPIVTILLYWIVFQFAFGSSDVNGHPFVLWLVAGLVPWFLIQDSITNGTNALLEYAYLVKKVMFKVSILPSIKVFSACFIHVVFMCVVFVVYTLLGYFPTIYYIQLLYYFICAIAFTLAIVYATSAIVLFVRDLGQFISVFMQVFMWSMPIMWNIEIAPVGLRWIFQLNPANYVITGYRDSLLNNISVFQHMGYTLYFWIIVIVLFIVGSGVFSRLRPHFADVL